MTEGGRQKRVDRRRMREDRHNQWGIAGVPDFDSYREPYPSVGTFEPLAQTEHAKMW
jgi:hypothetical protein